MAAIKEQTYVNYIVIDVETGGLKPELNPITQVGYIILNGDSLETIHEYESYVKGYRDLKYEQKALDYTGITFDKINSGLDHTAVVQKMIKDFQSIANPSGKAKDKPVLIGHNINFDIGFLMYIFNICKEDLFKYVADIAYDTMYLSKLKYAGVTRLVDYKLGTCVSAAGLVLDNAHSALADVKATGDLFKDMAKTLRGGVSDNGSQQIVKQPRSFTF